MNKLCMLAFCLFAFQIEKILANPTNKTTIETPVQINNENRFRDFVNCKNINGFDCLILYLLFMHAITALLGFLVGRIIWCFRPCAHKVGCVKRFYKWIYPYGYTRYN